MSEQADISERFVVHERITIELGVNEHGTPTCRVSTNMDCGGESTETPPNPLYQAAVSEALRDIAWTQFPHDCLEGTACRFLGCTRAAPAKHDLAEDA